MNSHIETQIRAKAETVFALAHKLYGCPLNLDNVRLVFKQKGKAAGQAAWKRQFGETQYELRFSMEAATIDLNDMLNDTVPHEIAHLVNFWNPTTGRNHDRLWKQTCIALGGTGERCYDGSKMVLTPTKIQRKWKYVASCGTELEVSTKIHNKIQRGQTRTLKRTGGRIASIHFAGAVTQTEVKQRLNERQAQVNDVKVAAQAPAPRPAPARGGQTKAAKAVLIIDRLQAQGCDKKDIVGYLIRELGMTPAGASTYYYKYR